MLERGGAQFNTLLSTEDAIKRGHDAWMIASPGALADEAYRRLGAAYIELGKPVRSSELPGVTHPTMENPSFVPARMEREVSLRKDMAAYSGLKRLIRLLEPDVVHTHSSKAGILGRLAAYQCGVRAVVHTAHGWGFHDKQSSVKRTVFEAAEIFAAKLSDKIVVVAEDNRCKGIRAKVGYPEQYITIRSGIEIDPDALLAEREEVRNELGIPLDAKVVVWAGNFKPQKAPLDMAKVAVKILEESDDVYFVAAGDGVMRAEVEKELGRWFDPENKGRMKLLGWRQDVPRIIASGEALVHTAYFEGLPRVILEALACGKPVVTTDVDGIPEVVSSGKNGYLFGAGDVDGISLSVKKLMKYDELRARLSAGAKKSFTEDFTLPKMFDDLEELYTELIND